MEDINTFNPFSEYNFIEQDALNPFRYGVVINADDKILSITEDGKLLAQVALDLQKNKLSLIGRDGVLFSTVDLPLVDVIEDAVYDDNIKSLIIYVKLSDGTNKEIVVPFNDLLDNYAKIDELEAETIRAKAAEIANTTAIGTKVDKAIGMGLSQESFTTIEKTKLDSLENYDDTTVKNNIATKQNILVSGTNIKTINNLSLLGSGNINITGGGTSYNIGDGLTLAPPNFLSVNINPLSESYISCDSSGILISGIDTGLDNAIKSSSFNAIDIANEASNKAKNDAIKIAELDASTKSTKAKDEAISAAALNTDNKIAANNITILSLASNDASIKSTKAKDEAISAATLNTDNKIKQVKIELDGLINDETNRAVGIETGLKTEINGKVSSVTLIKDINDSMQYILMVDGAKKGEINIPTNQFLKSADYDSITKQLIFIFNTIDGEIISSIDVADLVDTYTAGNGLSQSNNTFSILLDPLSEPYITISPNGVKISGIDKEINDLTTSLTTKINNVDLAINNEITRATDAELLNASNLDAFKIEIKEYVDNKFNDVMSSISTILDKITLLENKKYVSSEKIRDIVPMTVSQYEDLLVKEDTTLYTLTN